MDHFAEQLFAAARDARRSRAGWSFGTNVPAGIVRYTGIGSAETVDCGRGARRVTVIRFVMRGAVVTPAVRYSGIESGVTWKSERSPAREEPRARCLAARGVTLADEGCPANAGSGEAAGAQPNRGLSFPTVSCSLDVLRSRWCRQRSVTLTAPSLCREATGSVLVSPVTYLSPLVNVTTLVPGTLR
jgi:hypothetical protein